MGCIPSTYHYIEKGDSWIWKTWSASSALRRASAFFPPELFYFHRCFYTLFYVLGNINVDISDCQMSWGGSGDHLMGSRLQSTYCTILESASFFCIKGHLLS